MAKALLDPGALGGKMSTQVLNLPVNVPWKLIGVSQDMMDTQFCDKRFPIEWRSSLAVSAFEPAAEDLPENLCRDVITFLKVTCTITGYQPTRAETGRGHAAFPQLAALRSILDKYFACYGVLLNVAVFPFPGTRTRLDPVSTEFSQENLGDQGPNPLVVEDVSFQAVQGQDNRVIDLALPDGSSPRVLDLREEIQVTVPATPRVEAKVVHRAEVVTMEAYRGTQLVGSQTTGPARDGVDELGIDGDGIDRVVLRASGDEAFLVEFVHFTPSEVPVEVKDFPHIIDFEPKNRDLYQGATEDGELLTVSTSEVKTDKSGTRADSTETGVSWSGLIGAAGGAVAGGMATGPAGAAAGAQMGGTLASSLTQKWGATTQDTSQVQTDASRDRRERYSTSTNISQMYNLLTGYHLGTNRAVFLMLPRPHILQPTDFRTFVQGLRVIEGVQEFFLVVARPKDDDVKGLCVEASLETGHFPEDVTVHIPDEKFKQGFEDFVVTAESAEDNARSIEEFPSSKFTVQSGTVIDRSAVGSDDGHGGIRFLGGMDGTNPITRRSVFDHIMIFNYQPVDDATVQVMGRVLSNSVRHVRLRFRVFTHSQQPLPNGEPEADVARLIITCRNLCVCFQSGDCPEVISVTSTSPQQCIVDEQVIQINPALLTRTASSASRLPAMKETLRKLQSAMTNSGRLPSRRPPGEVGFLESDYFTNRIKAVLPSTVLDLRLGAVHDLPKVVVDAFGVRATVAETLEPDLTSFAARTGLSMEEAGEARFRLLNARPARPRARRRPATASGGAAARET